jgi:uncharacterized protein
LAPRPRRFSDPQAFFDAVQPICAPREIENSMILGAARRISRTGDPAFMIGAEGDAGLFAAAVRTPPYELAVCAGSKAEMEDLADVVVDAGEAIPAAMGVEASVDCFALRFCDRLEIAQRTQLRMTLYTLTDVMFPAAPAAGSLRGATTDDRERLIDWTVGFAEEAGLPAFERERDHVALMVMRSISEARRFIWEVDRQPVAMASYNDTGIAGARIGGVWTPPDRRAKGYATTLVASLSQRLLDSGKTWCALFADVKNPLSNRIYQRVGYRESCRFHSIRFEGRV